MTIRHWTVPPRVLALTPAPLWGARLAMGTVTLVLAPPAWADHPPLADQGGRLAEAHGHRLELMTSGESLEVLLKDEHNQALSADGYSGKAIVLAPGGKAEVPLAPSAAKLVGKLPAGGELAMTVLIIKASDGHTINVRLPALQPVTPPPADLVASGKLVYAANCANCHGEQLQGQDGWRTPVPKAVPKLAPALDSTGHGWRKADEQLVQAIRKGSDPMPAFAGVLSEKDIRAVVAYVKSSWPAATLAQQPKSGGKVQSAPQPSRHEHH